MKLLLIDGSNLIFRAYYATENQKITTPRGEPINAIHTLVSMVNKMIEEHKPTHILVALDDGSSTFRHEMYPEYKGKRSETPDNLKFQFPLAIDLYNAMGIKTFGTKKYEADDIIATYAQLVKEYMSVQIISGDKDLLQLIDDNVQVLTPGIGFAKEINYDIQEFKERFEFDIDRFIEYKAMIGDNSDNIIGINKLGDKTAKKFISQFENVDQIIEAAKNGDIKGKISENIVEGSERIYHNMELVTLVDNIEVDYEIDELKFTGFDVEKLVPFYEKMGFNKHLNKLNQNKENNIDIKKNVEFSEIEEFNINDHVGVENFIFTDTLTTNYFESENLGIGIYNEKGCFYLSYENINDQFESFLKSDVKKITYNLKKLMVSFNILEVNGFIQDIYIASSFINPANYKLDINNLAMRYDYNNLYTYEHIYQSKRTPVMPDKKILMEDICLKVQAISKIYLGIQNELEEKNLTQPYFEIEFPLISILARMELEGVCVDITKIDKTEEEYNIKIKDVEQKLLSYVDLNFNSSKQISKFLFEEKKLPTKGIKKTSSYYSLDLENISKLKNMLIIEGKKYENEIQFLENLIEYRKAKKILSTYIIGIKNHVENNKIHPLYHQLLTETGRLSSFDPNIQNIPIRSQEGQQIREFFNVPKGYKLLAIDYSQVELRIIAKMANEMQMIEDFNNGVDIHLSTAKKIFNKEEIKESERAIAKSINFGIIYGMSKYGLAKNLEISVDEAENFILKYQQTYPQILNYMDELVDEAIENGYSQTYFNRKRPISIKSKTKNSVLTHEERVAINTPIQGTAADIIKLSMIKVDEYVKDKDIKMIIQIHDELIFYVKETDIEIVSNEIKQIMENVVYENFDLIANFGIGDNWLEAK